MSIPVDSRERKDMPIFRGVLAYFPDALMEVARLSKHGNDKHNPGQPLHWAKHKSTDHADCIVRHQLEYDQRDEFGMYHAVAVAWRALAQLQILLDFDADQATRAREFDALEGPRVPTELRIKQEKIAADIFNQGCGMNLPSAPEVRFGMAVPKGPEPKLEKFGPHGWQEWNDYEDYSFWLGKNG